MTAKPNARGEKAMKDSVDDDRVSPKKNPRVWLRKRIPGSPKDAVEDFRRELKAQGLKIDYEVGYGKPPTHSRFKPGESGNPSGLRKKDRGLDVRALAQEAFLSEVPVREGGKKRERLPMVIALIRQKQKEALTDLKVFRELMRLAERLGVFNVVRKPKRDYSCLCPLKLSHYRCAIGRVRDGSEAVFRRRLPKDLAAG